MAPRMKEYKKAIAADSSDDEEEVELVRVNDENVDPSGRTTDRMDVIVPNMLPILAFLVVALMKAYCTDAPTLCLKTIEAIKERAIMAGEDPLQSEKAELASYVSVCLALERGPRQVGQASWRQDRTRG